MKQWLIENWFNFLTILIATLSALASGISAWYSLKANKLSKIANENSRESNVKADSANEIAKKANEISLSANGLSESANKIAEETVYNGYYWILNEISYSLKDIKNFIDKNDINKEENYKEMQYKFYCFDKSYTEIYNKGFKIPREKMAFYQGLINDVKNLKDQFNNYEFEEALEELEQVIFELEKRL